MSLFRTFILSSCLWTIALVPSSGATQDPVDDWQRAPNASTGPNMYPVTGVTNVGIGTVNPGTNLHVVKRMNLTGDEAVQVGFSHLADSIGTTGITVASTPLGTNALYVKGAQVGVDAAVSAINTSPQLGSAAGRLASESSFNFSGSFVGAQGTSTPSTLANFDATATSRGLGGLFSTPPATSLTLNGVGTYWVGGAYGEVSGAVNGNPGLGAVAAIIGLDNNSGTAPSWAGYFRGRSAFTYGNGAPVNLETGVSIGSAFNLRHGLWISTSNNAGGDLNHASLWIENMGSDGHTFYAADAVADPTPFVITNAGNVGVGTATPGEKLDVNGRIQLNDWLTFGGQLTLINTGGNTYLDTWTGAGDLIFRNAANAHMYIKNSGNVGIGTATPAALLHVNGTAGNNTGVWSNVSDRRLKKDIEPIQNALGTVEQLQPVSFRWKDAQKDAQFGRVRGLIAQDVEEVIPEWVTIDPDGYRRLEPIGIDALLIEAIKEQQKMISELKKKADQVDVLQKQVSELKEQQTQLLGLRDELVQMRSKLDALNVGSR